MKGTYFKSNKDLASHFLITFKTKTEGHNIVVKIYDINLPQEDIKIGDNVKDFDPELMCTLNIWNKYYFPTFNSDNNQWYHNYDGQEDRIGAVNDVLKYALDLGISKGNIELY